MEKQALQKTLTKVKELTQKVGSFILAEQQKLVDINIEVKSKNSLVSYVDKQAEEQLVLALEAILPEAGFIAEEGTSSKIGESYNWIIDPLDGTTNFLHGLPIFSISIALQYHNEIILGVVYEIGQKEMFYACKDDGAYCNGKKINVTENTKLSDTLIATGFPYYDYSQMQEFQNCLAHYMHHTRGVRRMGSAAVDLVYTAIGRFDCFFEYGLNSWDVAAGAFIVQQAGGKVVDYKGGNDFIFGRSILATNNTLHSEFLEITKKYF